MILVALPMKIGRSPYAMGSRVPPWPTFFTPVTLRHTATQSVSYTHLDVYKRQPFHLSLTVLFAIGHWVVFRLGGWALRLHTGFHVSGTTLVPSGSLAISPTGISPSSFSFSKTVRLSLKIPSDGPQPQRTSPLVWPLSLSLAAT